MKYLIFLLLLIQSCAISTPFKGPKYDEETETMKADPNKIVILALTNAKLNDNGDDEFMERSQEIHDLIEENEGYMGGSVRFEIFGDQVWTMTVWEDEKSLEKFVDGRRHLDAMYMTNRAMDEFRTMHIQVFARDLPYNWSKAERVLEEKPFEKHTPF